MSKINHELLNSKDKVTRLFLKDYTDPSATNHWEHSSETISAFHVDYGLAKTFVLQGIQTDFSSVLQGIETFETIIWFLFFLFCLQLTFTWSHTYDIRTYYSFCCFPTHVCLCLRESFENSWIYPNLISGCRDANDRSMTWSGPCLNSGNCASTSYNLRFTFPWEMKEPEYNQRD